MYLYVGFKVCCRFLSYTHKRNRALITGCKHVLSFKETVTHLLWLCKLKRYLCHICRSQFQVILGRLQWNGVGGVTVLTTSKIVHPDYNPTTISNDVAVLRLPNPVEFTSEYPSPMSLELCV
jgi:hypothetical protein